MAEVLIPGAKGRRIAKSGSQERLTGSQKIVQKTHQKVDQQNGILS
ncbi:hypothetical protein [Nocardia arthritidis]|nr:hypothetical protein [Nocardia arthritidis]